MVKNPPANAGDLRDTGSNPGFGGSPGGRHGNPLQCSCLENPMDRGAWRATTHRVTKSQTRLSDVCVCVSVCLSVCVCVFSLKPPVVSSFSFQKLQSDEVFACGQAWVRGQAVQGACGAGRHETGTPQDGRSGRGHSGRAAGNTKPGLWTSTGHRASIRPKSAFRVEGFFPFFFFFFWF